MALRPFNDPMGGRDPLVDKIIGNAYKVVRYVAENLHFIKYVAANMDKVYLVADGMKASKSLIAAAPTVTGTEVIVPFPEGVTLAQIVSSTTLLQSGDGSLWDNESGEYYSAVRTDGLHFWFKPAAVIVGGSIRWHFTFEV